MKSSIDHYIYQPSSIVKKYFTIILVGFILGLLTYSFLGFTQEEDNTKLLWLSGFLGVIIIYTNTIFNEIFNRFISWKKYTGLRLLTGVLSNTIISFLFISLVLYGYAFIKEAQVSFIEDYSEILLKLIILIFFASLVYTIIYFAIHSYYQYAKGQIVALQLERKQTELQLTALKITIKPSLFI